MKNLDLNLGVWLLDPSITEAEKVSRCIEILGESEHGPVKLGKASCHLAYRHLEGKRIPGVEAMLEQCEKRILALDPRVATWHTVRWLGSIRIARVYLHTANRDRLEGVAAICDKLYQPGWMLVNPTAAVNCCRAMCIQMAIAARSKRPDDARVSMERCREMLILAAPRWKLDGEAFCAGYELVQVARSIHTCVALMPYAKLKYQGDVADIPTTVDTQDYPFARSALATILAGLEIP